MDIKELKKTIEEMARENDERIREYKKNGGAEHEYLDGKATAFEEVLLLFK